jgi:SnoaL-like domain
LKTSQSVVIERLQQAQNAHDLEALLACFAPHFQGNHPVHPERGLQRIDQARENWSVMFHDIPDFHSELQRRGFVQITVIVLFGKAHRA